MKILNLIVLFLIVSGSGLANEDAISPVYRQKYYNNTTFTPKKAASSCSQDNTLLYDFFSNKQTIQTLTHLGFWILMSSSIGIENTQQALQFTLWTKYQANFEMLFFLATQSLISLQSNKNYPWIIKELEFLYEQAMKSPHFYSRFTQEQFDAIIQEWILADEITQEFAQKNVKTFAEIATGDSEIAKQLVKKIEDTFQQAREDVIEKKEMALDSPTLAKLLNEQLQKDNPISELKVILTKKTAANTLKIIQTFFKYGPPFFNAIQQKSWEAALIKNKGSINFLSALPYRFVKLCIAGNFLDKLEAKNQDKESLSKEIELMYTTGEELGICTNPSIHPFGGDQCFSKERAESLIALYRLLEIDAPGAWKGTSTRAALRLSFSSFLAELYKLASYLNPTNQQLSLFQPFFDRINIAMPICAFILTSGNLIERYYLISSLSNDQAALSMLQDYFKTNTPVFETILALAMIETIVSNQLDDQHHRKWIGYGKILRNTLAILIPFWLESRTKTNGPMSKAIAFIGIAFLNIYIAGDSLSFDLCDAQIDLYDAQNKKEKTDTLPEKITSLQKAIAENDVQLSTDFATSIAEITPSFVSEFIITALLSDDEETRTQMELLLHVLNLEPIEVQNLAKAYQHNSKQTIDWLTKRLLKKD
jgi:hypothetical protein